MMILENFVGKHRKKIKIHFLLVDLRRKIGKILFTKKQIQMRLRNVYQKQTIFKNQNLL